MNKNIKILPYKLGSESATMLAAYFECLKIKPDGLYRFKPEHSIINWGFNGELSKGINIPSGAILNPINSVRTVSNKLRAFEVITSAGVPSVEYTNDILVARVWIRDGFRVYCRTLLNSSEGKGIVIAEQESELVQCQLYTKYSKNTGEFRVHVCGKRFFIQEKRRMSQETMSENNINPDLRSKLIRNHDSGWAFCSDNLNLPEGITDNLKSVALRAIRGFSLHFGACDILYNRFYESFVLLEVNSAPGLTYGGNTHRFYCEGISELLKIPFNEDHFNSLIDN